jgi:hypothetical protein
MFQSNGEVARKSAAREGCNNVVLSPVKLPHHEGTWFFPRWWMRPVSIGWGMGVEIEGKVGNQRQQDQPR